MSTPGRPRSERRLALLLVALVSVCALLLGDAAWQLQRRAEVQRRQLRQLQLLRAEPAAVAALAPGQLPQFDGLFPGLAVVCRATPAGNVLGLQAAVADEVLACSR